VGVEPGGFPSPAKQERNGLTGTELGTEKMVRFHALLSCPYRIFDGGETTRLQTDPHASFGSRTHTSAGECILSELTGLEEQPTSDKRDSRCGGEACGVRSADASSASMYRHKLTLQSQRIGMCLLLLAVTARVGYSPARVGRRQLAPAARVGYGSPTLGLYEYFWDKEASFAERLKKFAFPEEEVPQILKSPPLGVPAISSQRRAYITATQRSKSVVRDLKTQAEIDDALHACRATGRLAVIKFYSPSCATCIASAPKFRRLAVAHAAVHDFYQINASARGKALAKACGVIDLPTAQIYASGSLALTHSVANKEFRNFEAGLSEQASSSACT
jgi:thiol-disulfide isomerase/thioredoxin